MRHVYKDAMILVGILSYSKTRCHSRCVPDVPQRRLQLRMESDNYCAYTDVGISLIIQTSALIQTHNYSILELNSLKEFFDTSITFADKEISHLRTLTTLLHNYDKTWVSQQAWLFPSLQTSARQYQSSVAIIEGSLLSQLNLPWFTSPRKRWSFDGVWCPRRHTASSHENFTQKNPFQAGILAKGVRNPHPRPSLSGPSCPLNPWFWGES